MARGSRPRRIRGPALQRRSGRESRSHHPGAEKRSAADYRWCSEGGRDASDRAGATSCASVRANEVNGAAKSGEAGAGKVGRANKSDESRASKNIADKNKPGAAQCIKKFSEARERAVAVVFCLCSGRLLFLGGRL